MIETVLQTENVPPKERFGYWHELVWNSFAPTDLYADETDRFNVRQRVLEIGDAEVWEVAFSASTLMRTASLIKKSDPETCCIAITRRGVMLGDTAGRRAAYQAGDLYCLDSSHPRTDSFYPPQGEESYQATAILIAKADLPLARRKIDQVVGTRVRSRDGVGALLSAFATELTSNTESFRPADGPRLGLVVIDLVSAMFAGILDDLGSLPETSQRNVLAMRIKAFILNRLSDPELTPSAIAAAHHISVSYLHRVFQNAETTVAGWVRHQRMEHARQDLADPALHATPIHAIAARWGFPRQADFSRAFRAAYGIAPKDYRRHAATRWEQAQPR